MSTERTRVTELAVWTGGQIKAARAVATTAASSAETAAKAYADTVGQQVRASILGGVDGALDTLQEVKTALEADDTVINGLLSAVGLRVRVDAAQTFTAPQQAQARANIDAASLSLDLGSTEVDYVAVANTAMTT